MDGLLRCFYADAFSFMMILLVLFASLTTGSFARRYMKGDSYYSRFFTLLSMLTISLITMVLADQILLFLFAWFLNNAVLVLLMIHKPHWNAALQSGYLAAKNFAIGFICIALAMYLLYAETGQSSIQTILLENVTASTLFWVQGLLLIGAMTQSAIFPFHRWLLSSLNSPTPVSAFMHAGLINGGGFLLIKFAPLYINSPWMLTVVFTIGFITAITGTLWKLMQSDIKRMLACSTMGQMGFMILQCGLGLYPAAAAHLVWHSLFKAYLFLSSASAAKEKQIHLDHPPTLISFFMALICGATGSITFTVMSGKTLFAMDTTLVLITVAFIAGCMIALQILKNHPFKQVPKAMMITVIFGGLYGLSVLSIKLLLEPVILSNPQPLHYIHIIAIVMMFALWFIQLFVRFPHPSIGVTKWGIGFYVRMLNASQPHPKTITAYRNQYRYE